MDVYQMPQGDWAWAAAGVIRDGYPSEAIATTACAEAMEYRVQVLTEKLENALSIHLG